MTLKKRIQAFERLRIFMLEVAHANASPAFQNPEEKHYFEKLQAEIVSAVNRNGWFTESNVRKAISSLGLAMTAERLNKWTNKYGARLTEYNENKNVGIVMAGNIPAVGFHDLLCVLLSGNNVMAKLSSSDNRLIPALTDLLAAIEPEFQGMTTFTSDRLKGFDAIIATGSNNSSRYFEYYFGKYPNIIRKNRNGVAVLSGEESLEELQALSVDISSYYGLGCRNVTHLFVPADYDFKPLLEACSSNTSNNENSHYFNNYEYNKAILLVNGVLHFDTGGVLFTESEALPAAVSVVHFSYYKAQDSLLLLLKHKKDQIQCVVTNHFDVPERVAFGHSQMPELWDYADGVDTMDFLLTMQ